MPSLDDAKEERITYLSANGREVTLGFSSLNGQEFKKVHFVREDGDMLNGVETYMNDKRIIELYVIVERANGNIDKIQAESK